jgi:hypothetical protein
VGGAEGVGEGTAQQQQQGPRRRGPPRRGQGDVACRVS